MHLSYHVKLSEWLAKYYLTNILDEYSHDTPYVPGQDVKAENVSNQGKFVLSLARAMLIGWELAKPNSIVNIHRTLMNSLAYNIEAICMDFIYLL